MKYVEDVLLEVKVLDDDAVLARRKDRKPMAPADYKEALRMADSLPGITVNDVLRVFPGARVISKS
ncbi:MAG TPA: hypothetical protein VGA01_06915 [Candidatus Binatia bacterium]|nr:hypothetical protein [Verrucomicrobiae bacterium]